MVNEIGPSTTPRAAATGAGTLILSRSDVERLLTSDVCIAMMKNPTYRRRSFNS